jgi:hypothetical protein
MIRLVLFTVVIAMFLLPTAVAAQDEVGSVSGAVSNGTEGGGDVAGVTVYLSRFQGMDLVEEFTTTVGEDGTYRFEDLPINPGEAYLTTVEYQGLPFRSSMILLTQEIDAERDVTVYEPTSDPSVLRIISRGIVIAGADPEIARVNVLEILAIENESDRAYVGDESGAVLRLAMPRDATDIRPEPGFDYGQLRIDGNVLISNGPVLPGSHNPMISYAIPYEGRSATLSIGVAMPTATLRVLVEEGTFDISSQTLNPAGTVDIGGGRYDVLSVDRPVIGDTLTVRVSGLPRENWNLPIGMSTLLASLAAGVGLCIGAVLIYQVVQRRRSGTPQPSLAAANVEASGSPGDLESQRLELASELNQLEAEFERGDLDEETYRTERAEILAELRAISLKLRGVEEPV